MGGELTLEKSDADGSTFALRSAAPPPAPAAQRASLSLEGRRALIVAHSQFRGALSRRTCSPPSARRSSAPRARTRPCSRWRSTPRPKSSSSIARWANRSRAASPRLRAPRTPAARWCSSRRSSAARSARTCSARSMDGWSSQCATPRFWRVSTTACGLMPRGKARRARPRQRARSRPARSRRRGQRHQRAHRPALPRTRRRHGGARRRRPCRASRRWRTPRTESARLSTPSCSTFACPGSTGSQLRAASGRCRRRSACARTPLIALTANAAGEDRQAAAAAGFADFVVKPFDARGACRLVARALRPRERTRRKPRAR